MNSSERPNQALANNEASCMPRDLKDNSNPYAEKMVNEFMFRADLRLDRNVPSFFFIQHKQNQGTRFKCIPITIEMRI